MSHLASTTCKRVVQEDLVGRGAAWAETEKMLSQSQSQGTDPRVATTWQCRGKGRSVGATEAAAAVVGVLTAFCVYRN